MPKAKRYTADELIKMVQEDGWYEVPASGGHRQYKHPVKSGRTTIPYHKGTLDIRTAKSILKQAGLE